MIIDSNVKSLIQADIDSTIAKLKASKANTLQDYRKFEEFIGNTINALYQQCKYAAKNTQYAQVRGIFLCTLVNDIRFLQVLDGVGGMLDERLDMFIQHNRGKHG